MEASAPEVKGLDAPQASGGGIQDIVSSSTTHIPSTTADAQLFSALNMVSKYLILLLVGALALLVAAALQCTIVFWLVIFRLQTKLLLATVLLLKASMADNNTPQPNEGWFTWLSRVFHDNLPEHGDEEWGPLSTVIPGMPGTVDAYLLSIGVAPLLSAEDANNNYPDHALTTKSGVAEPEAHTTSTHPESHSITAEPEANKVPQDRSSEETSVIVPHDNDVTIKQSALGNEDKFESNECSASPSKQSVEPVKRSHHGDKSDMDSDAYSYSDDSQLVGSTSLSVRPHFSSNDDRQGVKKYVSFAKQASTIPHLANNGEVPIWMHYKRKAIKKKGQQNVAAPRITRQNAWKTSQQTGDTADLPWTNEQELHSSRAQESNSKQSTTNIKADMSKTEKENYKPNAPGTPIPKDVHSIIAKLKDLNTPPDADGNNGHKCPQCKRFVKPGSVPPHVQERGYCVPCWSVLPRIVEAKDIIEGTEQVDPKTKASKEQSQKEEKVTAKNAERATSEDRPKSPKMDMLVNTDTDPIMIKTPPCSNNLYLQDLAEIDIDSNKSQSSADSFRSKLTPQAAEFVLPTKSKLNARAPEHLTVGSDFQHADEEVQRYEEATWPQSWSDPFAG